MLILKALQQIYTRYSHNVNAYAGKVYLINSYNIQQILAKECSFGIKETAKSFYLMNVTCLWLKYAVFINI